MKFENREETIFINNPHQEVNLFGKLFTAEELKNAVISEIIFRENLRKLRGDAE